MGLPSAWRLYGCLLKTHLLSPGDSGTRPYYWKTKIVCLGSIHQMHRFLGSCLMNIHTVSPEQVLCSYWILNSVQKNSKGFLKAEPESGGCTLLKMRHSINLWRFELLQRVLLSLLSTPLPCTAASPQNPERRLWNACLVPDSGEEKKTLMF